MKVLSGFRQMIKMGDFFNSNQMLRLQKETDYRTFTGGLISFGIVITIIIAFASMILETMNRTSISFTYDSERTGDPSLSVITASPDTNFMFAVSVESYNLSSQYRLFDVVFDQIESTYGMNYTYTPYPLEACTKEHWASLPEMYNNFQQHNAGLWLCPTIGTVIKLRGKFTSAKYNQFSVTLYPCSNSTDPNRPCGTPEQLNQFLSSNGQWNYFTYYYINSIVNAAQPQYKSYYLEDRNYIVFGPKMGAELDMYLNQIDITSDNSIWPFQDISNDVAYYVNFGPILYPFAVDNTTSFATFYMMKDPADQTYARSVQKIFVVFSFMGGLIGAILACLFIVNAYTGFAYQIALAIDVFKDSEETRTHKELKEESRGSVNFLHFLQYHLYSLIKKFNSSLKWPFIEYIEECREEILYQLDIKGMIKRIIFLEYAISYMLEDYHLSEMQKEKPILPSDVKKLRQKIEAREDEESEEMVDMGSIKSNKPFCLEPDTIADKNGISTNDDFGTIKNQFEKQQNSIIQMKLMGLKKISKDNKVMNSEEKPPEGKRAQNIKKIRESALQGNMISKRLLHEIVRKPLERSLSSNSIQKYELNFPAPTRS